MIRNLFLLIFSIFFFIACQSGQKAETEKQLPVIKSCKIYSSDFAMFDPTDQGLLIQEFLFNRQGFVTDLIRFDVKGNIINHFDITGQQNPFPMPGKPEFVDTVLTIINYDNTGIQTHKEVKEYNQDGLLVAAHFYQGDTLLMKKNTFEYDSLNLIWKDIYWDIELNQPRQVVIYKYEFFTD